MDELKQGWLSPTGEFWACSSYDHLATARELLRRISALSDLEAVINHRQPDDVLLALGWCSIGISSFFCHEWRISWKNHLTPEQVHFLRPYFEQPVWGIPVNDMCAAKWRDEEAEA